MKLTNLFLVLLTIFSKIPNFPAQAQELRIGIATPLTGDLATLGDNIQKTIESYRKRYLRHQIKFIFADSKKGSKDGLLAYQQLILKDKVDLLIGGTTSNGTMAAASLINKYQIPLLTPLTGGSNIDKAGEYIFRIGNSDLLNGRQQAEIFLKSNITNVALITEQTEYTEDISDSFRSSFLENGGKLTSDEGFLPDSFDFRSLIEKIAGTHPQAVFINSQTGLAAGIFIRQIWEQQKLNSFEIHSNFLTALNPDARSAAGELLQGLHFLNPEFDADSTACKKFFEEFDADHKSPPTIAFHSAGIVDILDITQNFLDSNPTFEAGKFKNYLLTDIKNYKGLMGTFSLDIQGNSDLGFVPKILS